MWFQCDGSVSAASNRRRPSNQDLIAAVVAIKDTEQAAFDDEVVRIARTLDAILSADTPEPEPEPEPEPIPEPEPTVSLYEERPWWESLPEYSALKW